MRDRSGGPASDQAPESGGGDGEKPPEGDDLIGGGGDGGKGPEAAGGGATPPDPEDADEADKPMEKRLMRYIWRWTRSEQIWVLFIVLISMPTYFLSLTLPVRIINQPIQGQGFEDATATQPFLRLDFEVPSFLQGWTGLGERLFLFEGWALERWDYLIALSTTFLALVCFNGLFKFYINTYKGRLGERMLRRMRYQLTDRVLRFPIPHFKRVKGSEVASMVKDEVEPFGEFIGDAFVQPLYLGGQALVAFVFILLQSLWLGLIAVGIIVIQAIIIPILRRRLLELGPAAAVHGEAAFGAAGRDRGRHHGHPRKRHVELRTRGNLEPAGADLLHSATSSTSGSSSSSSSTTSWRS